MMVADCMGFLRTGAAGRLSLDLNLVAKLGAALSLSFQNHGKDGQEGRIAALTAHTAADTSGPDAR